MKVLFRPNKDRMHKQDSWKRSAYAFVPYQTHFGELCGFAEDVVNGGQGFGMHPHQNMEISTVLLEGAQLHKDSTGNEITLGENAVQTMSAGTGILHSEINASPEQPFHSFQIWVYPKEQNVKPRHEQFRFAPADKLNEVLLTISPDGRKGTAHINQDALFSVADLEKDKSVSYQINISGSGVYIHCAKGAVQIGDYSLQAGDALGAYDTNEVSILATADSELIFVEVPMSRGIRV